MTPLSRTLLALACAGAFPAHATSVDQLDPVVVTATRTEQSLRDAPASISIITADDIQRKGAGDLLEALRGTPGISMMGHSTGGRKTFSIRGADSKHTLVLVDGQRITSTDDYVGHSDYQYNWVPMEQIERIEVIRGPMSALYGSEALGGVVNIITKKAGKGLSGAVSVRGEVTPDADGNSYQNSVRLSGKLNEFFDFSLVAEQARHSGEPTHENPAVSASESRYRRSGSLRLGFTPVQGQRLQLDVTRTLEERERNVARANSAYLDTYSLVREHKSLLWEGDWERVRADMSYSVSDIEITNRRSLSSLSTSLPQYLRNKVWNGNTYFSLGQRHAITLGAEYRDEYLRHPDLTHGSDDVSHRSAYLQDEILLSDDLTLTLGGRYDHHGAFGNRFSPRAYAVWQATDNLTIKGGYGTAFRAPTLKQSSGDYISTETPIMFYGNKDIRPETSRSYELGLSWQDHRSDYSVTLFESNVKDLISTESIPGRDPETNKLRRKYINVSRARLRGVELSTNQELAGGFSLYAAANLLQSRNRITGDHLTLRPAYTTTLGARWTGNKLDAGVDWLYTGDQYMEEGNKDRVAGYSVVNFNLRYALQNNVTVRAGIENIGNVNLEKRSPLYTYVERGRTLWVGLEAAF